MYKNKWALVFILLLPAGCSTTNQPTNKLSSDSTLSIWQPPAPGTEVAQIKERIAEDKLNEKYFKIRLIATDSSDRGYYLLTLNYAFSENQTVISFPKWSNDAYPKPVLQKGDKRYQALLGFDAGDGNLHPYYEIKADSKSLTLKKTNDYVLATGS